MEVEENEKENTNRQPAVPRAKIERKQNERKGKEGRRRKERVVVTYRTTNNPLKCPVNSPLAYASTTGVDVMLMNPRPW